MILFKIMEDFSNETMQKLQNLNILPQNTKNVFNNAPVLYIEKTDTTMNLAKTLNKMNVPNGTVIMAGEQTSGRGRIDGRIWKSTPDKNLLCTIILKQPPVEGFTLRIGLSLARTCNAFLPEKLKANIKWPNDILIEGKKVCGILCEYVNNTIFIGIGCNIGQLAFPQEIEEKATSLALYSGGRGPSVTSFLETLLRNIQEVLTEENWNEKVSDLLFKKNEVVSFCPGIPDTKLSLQNQPKQVTGILEGIGSFGELLIKTTEDEKEKTIPFVSGELVLDSYSH